MSQIRSKKGQRLEEIGKALKTDTAVLKRPIAMLLAAKKVRTEGRSAGRSTSSSRRGRRGGTATLARFPLHQVHRDSSLSELDLFRGMLESPGLGREGAALDRTHDQRHRPCPHRGNRRAQPDSRSSSIVESSYLTGTTTEQSTPHRTLEHPQAGGLGGSNGERHRGHRGRNRGCCRDRGLRAVRRWLGSRLADGSRRPGPGA
jgi:hypothetical protein